MKHGSLSAVRPHTASPYILYPASSRFSRHHLSAMLYRSSWHGVPVPALIRMIRASRLRSPENSAKIAPSQTVRPLFLRAEL